MDPERQKLRYTTYMYLLYSGQMTSCFVCDSGLQNQYSLPSAKYIYWFYYEPVLSRLHLFRSTSKCKVRVVRRLTGSTISLDRQD